MKQLGRNQSGMTFTGVAIVLGMIALCAVILIKIVPLYIEHFEVAASLKSLSEETGAGSRTEQELLQMLIKRLDINNVKHVTKDEIKIERKRGVTVINVDYEARVPLFFNLDIVAKFTGDQVEIRKP